MGKSLKKLVSDDIEAMLNKAIAHEYANAHIYFGMYSWLVDNGFNNAGSVLKKWGEEEHGHAHKVEEYIDDRNAKIIIPPVDKPLVEYKNLNEMMTAIFNREVETENIYKIISTKALREGDHPTYEFSSWFINEQREEIVKIRNLIDYAALLGDGCNVNYFMDLQFKELL